MRQSEESSGLQRPGLSAYNRSMDIYSILGVVLITCGVSLFIGAGIGFYAGVSKTEDNE